MMEPDLVRQWLHDRERVRRLDERMKPIFAMLPKKPRRPRKAPSKRKKEKVQRQMSLF